MSDNGRYGSLALTLDRGNVASGVIRAADGPQVSLLDAPAVVVNLNPACNSIDRVGDRACNKRGVVPAPRNIHGP